MPGWTAASHAGVKEQIRDLESKINDVRSKVNGIKQKTDFIPNNETERRDLFNGLEPGRITELFDLFKQGTSPAEALDLIKVLRDDGFLAFRDDATAQSNMRADLTGILAGIDRIRDEMSELRCYANPDRDPVESNAAGGNMAKFIDVLPPVVLYSMKKMLDEFTDGKWPTMMDDVGVPDELIAGDSLCSDPASARDFRIQAATNGCVLSHEQRVCNKLVEAPTLAEAIRGAREGVNFNKLLFGTIAEWLPDDAIIGGSLTVVGGGGAVVKVPVKGSTLFKTLANLMDLLERKLGNVLSRRSDCLAADAEMERDLLQCTALAGYDLDLCPAQVLALRRADSLGEDTGDLETATNFVDLSLAYQDLRGVGPRCVNN